MVLVDSTPSTGTMSLPALSPMPMSPVSPGSPWSPQPEHLGMPPWSRRQAQRSPARGNGNVDARSPKLATTVDMATAPKARPSDDSACCGGFFHFFSSERSKEKALIGQWQVHKIRPRACRNGLASSAMDDIYWTPTLYTIGKTKGTSGLTFSANGFRGCLQRKSTGWYEGALTDLSGAPRGVIRLKREADSLVSNYKADPNSQDWGSDNLAMRISEGLASTNGTNGSLSTQGQDKVRSKPTPTKTSADKQDDCCFPSKHRRDHSPAAPGQPLTLYLPEYLNGVQVLTRMAGLNRWQAHDTFLRSDTDGIFYRWSKDLDDRHPLMTVRFGDIIEGSDEGDGWVKCKVMAVEDRDRYLPMDVRGHRVLHQESEKTWRLDNQSLQDQTDGLGYRNSKNLRDVDTSCLGPRWGDVVVGVDAGHGWVKCEFDTSTVRDAASEVIFSTPTNGKRWDAGNAFPTPSTRYESPVRLPTPTRTVTQTQTPVRILSPGPGPTGIAWPAPGPSPVLAPGSQAWAPTPPRPVLPASPVPGSPVGAGVATFPYTVAAPRAATSPAQSRTPPYPANGPAWAWPASPSPTGSPQPMSPYVQPNAAFNNSFNGGKYTGSRFEWHDSPAARRGVATPGRRGPEERPLSYPDFDKVDRNHDGVIDKEEFNATFGRRSPYNWNVDNRT